MSKISVLIPAYNEELSLPELYLKMKEVMETHSQYEWEILFINDGSYDKTLEIIKSLRQQDNRINFVDLSRNFGKESAMLDNEKGCILGDDKPFDCRIWPLRVMALNETKVSTRLSGYFQKNWKRKLIH